MDIKHIRELTGLTQSNFAEKYHIPLDTLKGWEAMSYSSRYRECPEYVKYMLLRLVAIDYDYELEKIMERGNKRMSNEYVDLVDILLKKNLRSVFLKKQRNNNVLLIGQSGTGKKSCYIIPSIMQCCNSSSSPSIIVNDLNGSIYDATKEHLEKQGYDLQVVDLSFKNNRFLQFNPFSYMREETYEKDIYDIVSCFSEKYVKETYEPYWDDASRKVLNILFNAIYQEMGLKTDIPSIARECLTVGDDIVYNYNGEFKIARNTMESAMIQARLLLHPFAGGCFRKENELELNSIISKKTATFLTCNELPTEQTGIMLRIFYTTLFKQLEQICFKENSIPVRIYMDDLSVMGILDNFVDVLNKKTDDWNVGVSVMIESLGQLNYLFKNNHSVGNGTAEDLMDACDATMVLGKTADMETFEFVSGELGKARVMNDKECMLSVKGYKPFVTKKIVVLE